MPRTFIAHPVFRYNSLVFTVMIAILTWPCTVFLLAYIICLFDDLRHTPMSFPLVLYVLYFHPPYVPTTFSVSLRLF
jgi:hypothetical protein